MTLEQDLVALRLNIGNAWLHIREAAAIFERIEKELKK
jgi:hypothetical protein